jgi:hypothetical protein
MPAERDDRDLGRAAADVDDHVSRRLGNGSPGTDRSRHRLLDQVRLARAGAERRLLDRALLDAGDAGRNAHDDARMREAVLVHLLDEVAQHLLGHVEVGDHAVLERADRGDRPGVRPSIRFASTPTACTSPVRWSIATTDGSESTMPRPRTYTSVFAVPRSTAMSRPPKPPRLSKRPMRSSSLATQSRKYPAKRSASSRDEQRAGQPDDVEVVAVDAAHERGAAALDRVRARASLPLARLDVCREVARRQLAEVTRVPSCSTSSQPA